GAYRSTRVRNQRLLAGATLIVLLTVISLPLAWNAIETYGQSDKNRVAADVIAEWDPSLTVTRLVVDTTERPLRISLEVSGEGLTEVPDVLAALLARRFDSGVELTLDFQPVYLGAATVDES
ncbi:MAG: hypothetical protein ACC726_12640, partial [Chloroflexota bacterium]